MAIDVLDRRLVAPGDLLAREAEDTGDRVPLLRARRPAAEDDRQYSQFIQAGALRELLRAELLDDDRRTGLRFGLPRDDLDRLRGRRRHQLQRWRRRRGEADDGRGGFVCERVADGRATDDRPAFGVRLAKGERGEREKLLSATELDSAFAFDTGHHVRTQLADNISGLIFKAFVTLLVLGFGIYLALYLAGILG